MGIGVLPDRVVVVVGVWATRGAAVVEVGTVEADDDDVEVDDFDADVDAVPAFTADVPLPLPTPGTDAGFNATLVLLVVPVTGNLFLVACTRCNTLTASLTIDEDVEDEDVDIDACVGFMMVVLTGALPPDTAGVGATAGAGAGLGECVCAGPGANAVAGEGASASVGAGRDAGGGGSDVVTDDGTTSSTPFTSSLPELW